MWRHYISKSSKSSVGGRIAGRCRKRRNDDSTGDWIFLEHQHQHHIASSPTNCLPFLYHHSCGCAWTVNWQNSEGILRGGKSLIQFRDSVSAIGRNHHHRHPRYLVTELQQNSAAKGGRGTDGRSVCVGGKSARCVEPLECLKSGSSFQGEWLTDWLASGWLTRFLCFFCGWIVG